MNAFKIKKNDGSRQLIYTEGLTRVDIAKDGSTVTLHYGSDPHKFEGKAAAQVASFLEGAARGPEIDDTGK